MPGTVAIKYPVPSLAIPNEFDYSRFENELFSVDLFRIGNFEQTEFQIAGNVRFGCVRPAENVRLHALFLPFRNPNKLDCRRLIENVCESACLLLYVI